MPTPALAFDRFYTFISAVIDLYFPIRHIKVKEKDALYMTPVIKYLIRKRNKILKKRWMAQADALSARTHQMITRSNRTSLEHLQRGSRDLRAEINPIRGEGRNSLETVDCGITATTLNEFFGGISQDVHY